MPGRASQVSFDDQSKTPDSTFSRLTIRTALFLGFGLTFAIWLFAGYYFTRRIKEVEQRSSIINTRYIQAQDRLSTVRAQILLGSVYVRDALLDPDPATASSYRARVMDAGRSADRALEQYVPVLDTPEEHERVARLRHELDVFQDTMLNVLADENTRSPANARLLLSTQVVPKREVAIRVSEEVQALNRGAFVQQQNAVAVIYGSTQRRVWETLGVALAASFGVGLLAALYAGRLENRIRRQQGRDVQNARDLQHLSAKLITAQEEERRTIARELHDEVGQVLTAIKVELALAQHAMDRTGASAHLLDDARAITDGALTTVRDLSHLLHPALLDDLGLPAAVDWYLRGFGRRHAIRVEILHEGMDVRLAAEIEAAAYRIVQEALTNVARHANASACRVYLQRLPNTVLITIEDDGAGFTPDDDAPRAEAGLGLIGIRERVATLRGTLRIESTPGKGTRLTVELPARARPVAEAGSGVSPAIDSQPSSPTASATARATTASALARNDD